jgi:hypothetical protein
VRLIVLCSSGEAGEEEGTQNGKEAEATEMGSPTGTMCGQKKVSNKDKKLKRSNDGSVDGGAEEAPKDTTSSEGNYIDITDLLTLPQKEAAKKLGISESMLCKRFKECTRRKWPYRYVRSYTRNCVQRAGSDLCSVSHACIRVRQLRKIDKIINMLNLHKADGEGMSEEDRDKLTRLHKEREECLRPVKIRITSYDRLSPIMRHRKTSDCDEEDIPIDALQTLEMLRIFKPQGDTELSECGSAERDGNSSSEDEEELEDDLDDSIAGRKKSKGGEEGEEEEQTDELRMDADGDGDEDESECSMQLAHDEPLHHQHDGTTLALDLSNSSDTAAFIVSQDEDEMETVASGKLPR